MSITKRFCQKSLKGIDQYLIENNPSWSKDRRSYAKAFLLSVEYQKNLNIVDTVLTDAGVSNRSAHYDIGKFLAQNDQEFAETIQNAVAALSFNAKKVQNAIYKAPPKDLSL